MFKNGPHVSMAIQNILLVSLGLTCGFVLCLHLAAFVTLCPYGLGHLPGPGDAREGKTTAFLFPPFLPELG